MRSTGNAGRRALYRVAGYGTVALGTASGLDPDAPGCDNGFLFDCQSRARLAQGRDTVLISTKFLKDDSDDVRAGKTLLLEARAKLLRAEQALHASAEYKAFKAAEDEVERATEMLEQDLRAQRHEQSQASRREQAKQYEAEKARLAKKLGNGKGWNDFDVIGRDTTGRLRVVCKACQLECDWRDYEVHDCKPIKVTNAARNGRATRTSRANADINW